MKTTVSIIVSLLAAILLSARFLPSLAGTFLQDTATLYGSRLTSATVTATGTHVDWPNKTLTLSNIAIRTDKGAALVDIDSMKATLPNQFKPALSQHSLLPSIMPVTELVIDGMTLSYDVDNEGNNLKTLRQAISTAASTQSRQRLNAAFNTDTPMPQRFTFGKIIVKGIEVNARSKQDITRQQTFALPSTERLDVGVQEDGLSFAEAIDATAQTITENIRQEALARGLLIPERRIATSSATDTDTRRARKSSRTQPSESNDAPEEGNSVKKTAKGVGKAVGHFFRDTTKKLFGSD